MKKTTTPGGDMDNVTPLMQQYYQVKSKHPEAILLFRVGDFYETFGEDAVKTSQALGIVLTSRNNGGSDIELAGFPYHSMDMYLPRLVRAGYRVAICEQLEKPSKEKKIVQRGVTEVVTPGVALDDQLLDHKSNNYLAALFISKKEKMALAFLDISTGEFLVSEGDAAYVDKLLQTFQPSEVVFAKSRKEDFNQLFGNKFYTYCLDEWAFSFDFAREKLLQHFQVSSLKGFGIEDMELAQIAAGAILHYLETTENRQLRHINNISRILPDRYVWLDRFTIRNLELVDTAHDSGTSLLDVLDQTTSPMGARLLKKWVLLPLKSLREIKSRQEMVERLIDDLEMMRELEMFIRQIGDLERLAAKTAVGKVNPREVLQIRKALQALIPLQEILQKSGLAHFEKLAEGLNPCPLLIDDIGRQLVDDPPVNVAKGGVIQDGFSQELDDYRYTITNSKDLLINIQQEEIKKTGINSLKIGFNSVFGYYLEVTNKYKDQGLIPDSWVRKQTLTNAERYITEELKTLETKILSAEERVLELETQLFAQLVEDLANYIQPLQHNAALIARLDCLLSFARIAGKNQYVRPDVDDSLVIDIKQGRHPVIERHLRLGESYIPNDVLLDPEHQQIMMITGPNMSGKSALLRQTALICLMSQMGSFVPAASARIGMIDKVFTRVGASDNISSGESTFMVEMNETASIMNNVSDRSLILLDEIGRGTSTYDGISIAWSIAEYLHEHPQARPKTLFATHYHELNDLSGYFHRIQNFHVATREMGQKVLFLRKLEPGGSEHSFGIHVAKMAGMPKRIVDRANQILAQLEEKAERRNNTNGEEVHQLPPRITVPQEPVQLKIFEPYDAEWEYIKKTLMDVDINTLTPIDCMLKLREFRQVLEGKLLSEKPSE